jgi:putative protease
MNNTIEIMSPVGNYETLMAAIQGGADSVYFGVEHLNMRAKSANNFTLNELNDVVNIAHKHNVKAYLALNTIIYDHEINLMNKILQAAAKANIDAVIASDMAAITAARNYNLSIHASTQLNISNSLAAEFFSQFCDTIVLARELTLNQTKKIIDYIKQHNITGPSGNLLKVEIFIHGALCMAISGKCYLSLHEFNSSANRGACQQTCRRPYLVIDRETGYELEIDNEYIMSPKDLATLPFLDKILQTGVNILKIEGRARPPEYVKTVTQVYKQAVEAIQNNSFSQEKIQNWMDQLATVFNRGFWDGYYLGRKLGEWAKTSGSAATHKKVYVGKITNFFSKINVAEIHVQAEELSIGDEILIIGNKTGIFKDKVKEIRLNNKQVNIAPKGSVISIPLSQRARKNDKLYKWVKIKN